MSYEDINDKLQSVLDNLGDEDVDDPYYAPAHMKSEEEQLRKEFPGLQDLWDQYQVMLKLCKDSKPKPDPGRSASDILAAIRARQRTINATQPQKNKCEKPGDGNETNASDVLREIRYRNTKARRAKNNGSK